MKNSHALLVIALGLIAGTAPLRGGVIPSTFVVNSTGDAPASGSVTDGVCTTGATVLVNGVNVPECTLRAAMQEANGTPGANNISFNIPGAGVKTIAPASQLPILTEAVTIDGYTQPGASANTNSTNSGSNAVLLIFLDLSPNPNFSGDFFVVKAPSIIRGLAISNGRFDNIVLDTGSGGSRIEGCFIGTNPAGTDPGKPDNQGMGINVMSDNNVIGGTTPAARNVISGNLTGMTISGSDNHVEGNLVGTNAAGTGKVAAVNGIQQYTGIRLLTPGSANVIGGTTPAARNVVSGQAIFGITQDGSIEMTTSNVIVGNYVGLDVTGAAALPNEKTGIGIQFAGNGTIIGGTTPGARNVVAGNGSGTSFGYYNVNIDADGRASAGTIIQGNFIGTNADGTAPPTGLPANIPTDGILAGQGVTIGGSAPGAANLIAFNPGTGVLVYDFSENFHIANATISANSIHSNGALGIDLGGTFKQDAKGLNAVGNGVTPNDAGDSDDGPNKLQNFPVLTSADSTDTSVTITGTLNSTASTTFRLEFFRNDTADPSGNGEGQVFLGAKDVTTNASGDVSFSATFPTVGVARNVSATATDPSGSTSEFSAILQGSVAPATVQFSSGAYSVNEGAGSVTITVTRTGDTSAVASVHYATTNGTATTADYTNTSGDLAFGIGETSKTFTVAITDDSLAESDENFSVSLSNAAGAALGTPSTAVVTITDNDAPTTPTPTPTPTATPPTVQLSNISGRAFGQQNEKVSICGFIISGGSGKQVMVRGIGPSMKIGNTPVAGRMQDPMIELYDGSGTLMRMNDDWGKEANKDAIASSGLAPTDPHEAAILTTLQPGGYTAILRGANNSSGIGLVEVYETNYFDGEFANVSVRADVLNDDNVLINGLILRGALPKRFLFRALGPELHARGITGELQNPMLDVYNENGTLLGSNDDWKKSPDMAAIQASGFAPTDDREAAVILTLAAGNYTAIVSGVDRTTGVGLAEAFKLKDLPSNAR